MRKVEASSAYILLKVKKRNMCEEVGAVAHGRMVAWITRQAFLEIGYKGYHRGRRRGRGALSDVIIFIYISYLRQNVGNSSLSIVQCCQHCHYHNVSIRLSMTLRIKCSLPCLACASVSWCLIYL